MVVLALAGVIGAAAWLAFRGSGSSPAGGQGGEFVECAAQVGIRFHMDFLPGEQGVIPFKTNLYDHGCGVSVADFDGDGYDDIFFANQLGNCTLYRNKGDGRFEDVTERAGVGLGDRVCVMGVWGDYDNDGKPDLYVTSTRGGNVLFRNRGDGTFEEVTKKAGVGLVAHSQSAVFWDMDGDGHLDLLVINTAKWTQEKGKGDRYYPGPESLMEMAKAPLEKHVMFRNRGDGTFEDVTESSGLGGEGWGGDAAVFDYDGDGKLDVYITNMFGRSRLYRNEGKGKFTDVTDSVLKRVSWGAIGAKAFDYDNDGMLDLLTTDMHSDMWWPSNLDPVEQGGDKIRVKYRKVGGFLASSSPAAGKMEAEFAAELKVNYETSIFGNTLFRALGKGKFEEVSDRAGVETWWPWGIATGDFDNDGFEDVYLPSGMGFPYLYWPSPLLMNNGDGTFSDLAERAGIDPPTGGQYLKRRIADRRAARSARAAAVSDFRRAGKLDLVVNNFNDRASYFRNDRDRQNYLQFLLEGAMRPGDQDGREKRKSSRDAVGALVYLRFGKEVLVRQVQAAGGYLSQSSRVLHFGLGDRTSLGEVEVVWPSGRRQVLKGLEVNRLHHLREPVEE
jgi:hypothetical protein